MHNKAQTLTLAFCIALLPPIWAVAAPYLNVTTTSWRMWAPARNS